MDRFVIPYYVEGISDKHEIATGRDLQVISEVIPDESFFPFTLVSCVSPEYVAEADDPRSVDKSSAYAVPQNLYFQFSIFKYVAMDSP